MNVLNVDYFINKLKDVLLDNFKDEIIKSQKQSGNKRFKG